MESVAILENGLPTTGTPKYIKVSGLHNYYVVVDIKRKPGTTNSSVIVKTYTNSTRATPVHVAHNWSHANVVTNPNSSIMAMNDDTYHLSPLGKLGLIRSQQEPRAANSSGTAGIPW